MDPDRRLADRVSALEARFREIARTRMAGLPFVHGALDVRAVGFEVDTESGGCAMGVLLTPWFLNLVRLPLDAASPMLGIGEHADRDVGTHRFDFIGACDEDIGAYEFCSLYSPVLEFADQAAAVATAEAVLAQLRADAAGQAAADVGAPITTAATIAPAPASNTRRGFLFGRRVEVRG